MKKFIVLLIVLAGAGAFGAWSWSRGASHTEGFKMHAVHRGDMQVTISATGTIEPEEVVDIGAQVAGQVKSLGPDPRDPKKSVDYTTPVEQGTVLAVIDDALYAADVAQAEAAVEAARANKLRADADLIQLKAKQYQADRDLVRAKDLHKKPGAIAEQDFDMYQANFDTTSAAIAVGEAGVTQAEKSVLQAVAVLEKAQKNLGYCTIRSPVKGVIVDRRINVGQTVVSSLNAPSLFLIAKDLKRLQVWVSVNEADIGQIHPGQPVTFTVDAFPREQFRGEVGKIRLNATMTQNVVTYTVEVNTDNSSGKLLPYLTANVQFEVGKRSNVLLVPNAALRWLPQPSQVAPDARSALVAASQGKGKTTSTKEIVRDSSERGTLWVRDEAFVRPIRVKVGWSDGVVTEVEGEDLKEGLDVVVGETRSVSADSTTNPFAPKMFGGTKNGKQ